MLMLLTEMVLYQKILESLQLSWIGLLGEKKACLHLETP
jgi:hypothetical protein